MRISKVFSNLGKMFTRPNCKVNTASIVKHSMLIMGFQVSTMMYQQHYKMDNEGPTLNDIVKKAVEQEKSDKIKSLKQLTKHEACKSSDIEEGQIFEFSVKDEETGKMYPLVLVRHKGKVFVVGGICPYDGKTKLSEGVCFENKLYCPLHGCAFNIHSGEVELAPAIDDIARFYAEEIQGKVYVYAPKSIPKRLIPHTMPRDYNDMRKVVIVGTGPAGQACVETLRHNGYQGEIIMISKETKYPYDKTQMTKKVKGLKYKDIQLRDAEWYNQNGVQLLLGREVTFIDKTHGSPHIKLEDGLRLEYDCLLLATGSMPMHKPIMGSKDRENVMLLENMADHERMQEQLDKAKNITIMGMNDQSLELAATIRKEYDNIKEIYIIDENKDNPVKEKYGHEIGQALLQEHLNNDIWFVLNQEVKDFKGTQERVKKIRFENGLEINTDLVMLMPSNRLGNTEWVDDSQLDNFEFDDFSKFKTSYFQRSNYKRIFCAGDCANTLYFASNDKMGCEHWNVAWHQGETAAYNMLALRIPWHQIPFYYTQQYDKVLQYAGYAKHFNQVYIDGSVKDWDFVAYYAFYDEIVAVAGTPSKRKAVQVLQEAIRLEIMPLFPDIERKIEDVNSLEQQIRKSGRSGCFREQVYKIRYEPLEQDVVWYNREKQNQYYNVYQQGMTPTDNKIRNDDD